jgi:site-specific DNA-methyltransferase (adenine-specific)
MINVNYNPDVLDAIANLSNDEVFTPPKLVNEILDMLPQELFESKTTTFLDPVSKSGVFLREIAKRLMTGLEKQIPDKQERANHILQNQLFGIAITELTSLLSRRSVYGTKVANNKYSFCETFKNEQGNLIFDNIQHTWKDGKCTFCGASQDVYDRADSLETYAYQFIHTNKPEKIFNMKFDVIIGNPPYQLTVGKIKDNYSIPLYHKFVLQAKKLNPRYLVMITPSRWFAGGRGLDEYRREMLNDERIRVIYDYPEAIDCFPGTQIKGGVSYFLWDRDNKGYCKVTTNLNGKESKTMYRPLLEDGNDSFIRFNESIEILRKVRGKNENSIASLISPQTPFGFVTSFKGNKKKKGKNDLKLYVSGGFNFIEREKVLRNINMIDVYKIFIPKAGSGSDKYPHTILGKPIIAGKSSVCNQTYLYIGPFKDKKECENVVTYISTKFFRFMVMLKKNTQDAMRGVYQFVPIQDFSKSWTDEKLYKKYNLTQEEIDFIESMIRPME